MKKVFILALFLGSATAMWSQQDAWVFFTDKENVAASLANPISILTQDALDRKNLHNTPIDERDVPVNEDYISTIKSQTGIQVLAKSKWFNCVHVRGSEEDIGALENLTFVDSIDFADNSLSRSANGFGFIKDDPEPEQRVVYNYGATDNQVTQLGVQFLHEQDFVGNDMVVAVLDSGFPGVDVNGGFSGLHVEGRLLDGYDFVDREDNEFAFSGSTHGARVASDIVGFIEDEFVGTAPHVFLYCFRTEDVGSENPVEESYWVEAAERADSLGVDIINTSLGYRTFDNPAYDYSYEDMNGETTFISRGATHAFDKGMLVVTSAGNSGAGMISAPADSPGALAVGAVDSDGNYASFSSIGPSSDGRVKPDVMAKGAGSAVIDQNNNITTNNGTSFSSPIMAGAVASLWQASPEKTNAEIMQIVREAAHLYPDSTPEMGYGIPDFGEALQSLSVEENTALAKTYVLSPNPASQQFEIQSINGSGSMQVTIYDLLGKQIQQLEIEGDSLQVDTSRFTSGIYLIQILEDNRSSTQKLIIK